MDELIDDKRVSDILINTIKKLQARTCKPSHWWRTPKEGDDVLVCDTCGRELEFVSMSQKIHASIVSGYENRHGLDKGKAFRKAFDSVYSAKNKPRRFSFDAPAVFPEVSTVEVMATKVVQEPAKAKPSRPFPNSGGRSPAFPASKAVEMPKIIVNRNETVVEDCPPIKIVVNRNETVVEDCPPIKIVVADD